MINTQYKPKKPKESYSTCPVCGSIKVFQDSQGRWKYICKCDSFYDEIDTLITARDSNGKLG